MIKIYQQILMHSQKQELESNRTMLPISLNCKVYVKLKVIHTLMTWCDRRKLTPFYVSIWIRFNTTWREFEWHLLRYNSMYYSLTLKKCWWNSLTFPGLHWLFQGFQGFPDHWSPCLKYIVRSRNSCKSSVTIIKI